jgi:hypothetical protein
MTLQQVFSFLVLAMAQLGGVTSRSTILNADFADDENSFQFRNDYFDVSGVGDLWTTVGVFLSRRLTLS